mgnify:CR=1 FL=1
MKFCIKCNNKRDGSHYSYCKTCNAKRSAEYKQNNKEKIKESKKEYRQNNKEQIKESDKKHYQNNKEKINKQQKEYKQKNKEKINKRDREYKQNNPHKVREASRRRRALKKGNTHKPYTEDQVLKLYGKDCHICKKPINLSANRSAGAPGWQQGLHIDHVVPLSKGGADTIDNVKPAHGLCNLQKNDSID